MSSSKRSRTQHSVDDLGKDDFRPSKRSRVAKRRVAKSYDNVIFIKTNIKSYLFYYFLSVYSVYDLNLVES